MVSGSIVLQRWGRWETCIDFSFCWGKQACCSWARVQWGRPNVLDCSSSLSAVSCDGYETPWKQLIQKTMKTLSICVLFCCFYRFAFKTVQVLRVIMYLIALSEAKKAGGENLAIDPERKLSQHHPGKRWVRADQSWRLYSILGLAGRKCLSNTSHDATGRRHPIAVQPLPNSYKQWMNTKYNNLCELCLVCSAQTISSISSLHGRWGLIKKTSDSYQHLHLPVLFDFAGEDTDLIWGHNLQCLLVNVPVVVGQNKMFTTHSGAWQGLEALAVSSLPA